MKTKLFLSITILLTIVSSDLFAQVRTTDKPIAKEKKERSISMTNLCLFEFDSKTLGDSTLKIISLAMTYVYKGKEAITLRTKQNESSLTIEMQNAICHAKPGDKIYFENIRVKETNGTIKVLSAISYTVK